MNRVLELFGVSTKTKKRIDWKGVEGKSWCPFLNRMCLKNRKSRPDILIGTCSVAHGREEQAIIICPHRLLERRQIFTDCIHLLSLHEPGNEFHIVPEVPVPGGSVDYFLVSVNRGKVQDFVGIELQTLDTTGTVWPERQRFLRAVGLAVADEDVECKDTFGMNWKMTAKTILVQLHHKVETFESINKHFVLVVQTPLVGYMKENFAFEHVRTARLGDSMHLHGYDLGPTNGEWRIELSSRLSTDATGVGKLLGLQTSARVELEAMIALLQERISPQTIFEVSTVDVAPPTKPS